MTLLKSDAGTLKKWDEAPYFKLINIDNKEYSLSDFSDKILVIIFMCNHCPYVKPKFDEIAAIQNDYENQNVVVICINSNDPNYDEEDSFENMKLIAQKKSYKYYLFDETQEVAVAYGATCTPDPFVFDKKHRLVYHGRINDAMEPGDRVTKNDIKEVLDNILENKDIKEWFVPSRGCSIKWKV